MNFVFLTCFITIFKGQRKIIIPCLKYIFASSCCYIFIYDLFIHFGLFWLKYYMIVLIENLPLWWKHYFEPKIFFIMYDRKASEPQVYNVFWSVWHIKRFLLQSSTQVTSVLTLFVVVRRNNYRTRFIDIYLIHFESNLS